MSYEKNFRVDFSVEEILLKCLVRSVLTRDYIGFKSTKISITESYFFISPSVELPRVPYLCFFPNGGFFFSNIVIPLFICGLNFIIYISLNFLDIGQDNYTDLRILECN